MSARPEVLELIQSSPKPTLNGERAHIGGFKNAHATVTSIKSGVSFEWSWEAVERILRAGGKFRS